MGCGVCGTRQVKIKYSSSHRVPRIAHMLIDKSDINFAKKYYLK